MVMCKIHLVDICLADTNTEIIVYNIINNLIYDCMIYD